MANTDGVPKQTASMESAPGGDPRSNAVNHGGGNASAQSPSVEDDGLSEAHGWEWESAKAAKYRTLRERAEARYGTAGLSDAQLASERKVLEDALSRVSIPADQQRLSSIKKVQKYRAMGAKQRELAARDALLPAGITDPEIARAVLDGETSAPYVDRLRSAFGNSGKSHALKAALGDEAYHEAFGRYLELKRAAAGTRVES